MSVKRDKDFYLRMNRVIDKLALTHLSPNESKYCWVVFRKTFGFGKYTDLIRRDLMARLTGINPVTVSRTKKGLVRRNIIYQNSKFTGFNLDIGQWEKVTVSLPFEKVTVSLPKGNSRAEKKGNSIVTVQRTNKLNTSKKENFYQKLPGEEIDKLELDQWYKAIMFNQGKFSIFYIEGTISDYPYNTRMSCWYLYGEAKDVRDKEAYFSKLLRDYSEKER